MLTEPKIVERADQPYAAILLTLTQPEISEQAPPLIDDVIAWVKSKGGELAGPPYFNYVSFFPGGRMEMQAGMPTTTVLPADGRFTTGAIPGGKYASITATVPYHELHDANMKLDEWARAQGYEFAGKVEGDNFVGATRLEIYHKDPGEDPSGHPVTEIAFRVK
ncbi:GyrI-like domain-containing protein [Devosia sp. SL43]|uniref:GyrI-like domain-containing protein n=1 Tax=Devosia sp. SL43 TaxID=2806348 RepID=UPI001F406CF5|nr:GyrI-like domain-containing protein [Devosia sp. SL43]UJW86288.1 GyrI-like domain-containing protein [Devosia sp. SL43]